MIHSGIPTHVVTLQPSQNNVPFVHSLPVLLTHVKRYPMQLWDFFYLTMELALQSPFSLKLTPTSLANMDMDLFTNQRTETSDDL